MENVNANKGLFLLFLQYLDDQALLNFLNFLN